MRVKTNQRELSEIDFQRVVTNHTADYSHKLKLKRYYLGLHDILRKEGRTNTDVNNKLVSNYCAYITNMSTGFFLGQPVSYKTTTEHESELKTLLEIFRYNDEAAHNVELAEEASITGEAFEFLYVDGESNIRFASVPSEEVIIICDATLEENILYGVRHYRVKNLDGVTNEEFVDIYDAQTVRHYSYNSSLKFLSEEPHYFDDVPIIEFPNNRQRRGDFEDVMTLVDAYNMAQSLTLDDLQDFTDAFLVLKGMGGTDDDDAKDLRRRKIISLDGDGAGAEWLIKNINDTYVENVKTRLERDIHKFSHMPDLSDENFASNASGVAIKYKLVGLEQIRSRKEREFKKAIQRRIELISGMMKLKSLPAIDFRNVEMAFTANIPANVQELAQIATTLEGMVSQKTLLGLLPFVPDPLEEIDELKRDRNEVLEEDHTHDFETY